MDSESQRAAAEIFAMIRMERMTRRVLTAAVATLIDYRRDLATEAQGDGDPKFAGRLNDTADEIEADLHDLVSHLQGELDDFVADKWRSKNQCQQRRKAS